MVEKEFYSAQVTGCYNFQVKFTYKQLHVFTVEGHLIRAKL